MTELSNKLIGNELKKGNVIVFESIFKSYYKNLTQFAFRFIADKTAAEDLVQEVFIGLWENRKKQNIESITTYLYVLVKNKCLNYLRNINIQDKHEEYLMDYYVFNDIKGSDIDEEYKTEILTHVEKLPKQMKLIFRAKYIHGLRSKEIAEDLGISENTVTTQLKRAKFKLREELLKVKKK